MGVIVKPTTKNRDKPMKTKNKYVGFDVHKVYPPPAAPKATRDTAVVVVADGGREGKVRLYGEISSDLRALNGAQAASASRRARRSPGRRSLHRPRARRDRRVLALR